METNKNWAKQETKKQWCWLNENNATNKLASIVAIKEELDDKDRGNNCKVILKTHKEHGLHSQHSWYGSNWHHTKLLKFELFYRHKKPTGQHVPILVQKVRTNDDVASKDETKVTIRMGNLVKQEDK